MNEYKVIYKSGLFEKTIKYFHAESHSDAWRTAVNKAPLPLLWYKNISVKKIEPITQARYDDMKETALWGWCLAFLVLILDVIAW